MVIRSFALSASSLGVIFSLVSCQGSVQAKAAQESSEPKIIGTAPKGLSLIPRKQYGTKKMPEGWTDSPLSSGTFIWEGAPNAAIMFPLYKWVEANGDRWTVPLPGDADSESGFWNCPYVFGTEARRFKVQPPIPAMFAFSLEVEVPPYGKDAPKLGDKVVTVGPWKLTFKPQKWMGPLFALPIQVTAEGLGKDEMLFLNTTAALAADIPGDEITFCVKPGETSRFESSRPDQEFTVRLVKPVKTKVTLKGKPMEGSKGGGWMDTELFDSAGTLRAKGMVALGTGTLISTDIYDEKDPMKLKDIWVGSAFETEAENSGFFSVSRITSDLLPGVHDATVYKTVRKEKFTLKAIFPKQ